MSVVGIVPAAGYGTRLQPREGSKEVFPVAGKPVMDYEIERQRRAPCDAVRVVTRPEKDDVKEHAAELGAEVVEGYPGSLAESFYTGLRDLPDEDVALLGFPDSIWDPEPHAGYREVLAFHREGDWDVALGLLPAPDMSREEPVIFDPASGRVDHIEFKPENPSADRTWCCAVAAVRVLKGLSGFSEAGKYFDSLCASGRVGAIPLAGTFLDMGTWKGLEHARAAIEPA